ncbi:hypothetical protein SAMN05421663_102245 [Terribacillus halophilus]|uniref:Uncharacterized protein n=1 Tax=Terribacillus halophilus TaxID=361279 RepID=A0A1G6L3Y2_9BACI|nr:hypothetical protein [Terribacillus halophilus]SDC37887.1 hypothetical protein SAMN05421663_102245 [Terribacillus halophilus]
MHFEIKCTLNEEQIILLNELKGATLINLFIEDCGDFALNVALETETQKLLISNKTITASDDDDYPRFVIQKIETIDDDYIIKKINKVINSISIIRDNSTWHNSDHHWDTTCDAAIKLTLEDEFLYLIAHDSIAGFIKLEKINDENKEGLVLKDYWAMKTDNIDSQNWIFV